MACRFFISSTKVQEEMDICLVWSALVSSVLLQRIRKRQWKTLCLLLFVSKLPGLGVMLCPAPSLCSTSKPSYQKANVLSSKTTKTRRLPGLSFSAQCEKQYREVPMFCGFFLSVSKGWTYRLCLVVCPYLLEIKNVSQKSPCSVASLLCSKTSIRSKNG